MRYASTDWDTMPAREQLSAHEVLCPGCYSHDLSNRDILLQKALFLSQFLRLFMIIDGVFLVLWALMAWPFFIGLLLITMGFYGVKYYNTALSSMYGVYLLANLALRVWWLTMAHAVFDIIILSLGLAVTAYIFYLLCSFIWTIGELRDEERVMLATLSAWDFGYSQPVIIAPIVINAPPDTFTGMSGYYPAPAMREPHASTAPATGATETAEGQTGDEGKKAPGGPTVSPPSSGRRDAHNILV